MSKTKTIILSITPQTWVPFDRNKTVLFRIPEECRSRHRVTGLDEDKDKPCDMYLGGETYCYHLNEEGEKVFHTLSKVGRSIVRRVKRYNEYKDALWDLAYDKGFKYPHTGLGVRFFIPCPKRWTKTEKRHAHMTWHQQTPDLSNYLKAVEDALLTQDKVIAGYAHLEKKWVDSENGWIEFSVPTREKQDTL